MEAFVEEFEGELPVAGDLQARRREPARPAEHAPIDLHHRVRAAVDAAGIDGLYRHQVEAIRALRDGDDAVIATPTASGKSLVYAIAAVESALGSGARTLYVAPTRALINDQEASLVGFADDLGFGPRVEVAQYTGRQTRAEKRRVREAEPHVVLTTPDMLHYGLLPHSYRLWEWLFRTLDLVVLDEVHEYRGVFGSHVGLVLRRLGRVCERFGAAPRLCCCSATIGNPVEHAAALTGRDPGGFRLVDDDASPRGPRTWLLWNPPPKRGNQRPDDGGPGVEPGADDGAAARTGGERRSSHPVAAELFCSLLQRGHRTLVFCGARQTAERYARRSAELLERRGEFDLAGAVAAYQAALPRSRRDEIEGRLHNGSLHGVWSTNALELGIDVGSLDAVLLDGYPGTRMETNQRAGRAGRGTDPSLVGLVAGRDALDQYLMAHPEALFDEPPERAIVNPENPELLPGHVRCAAAENWLSTADAERFGETFADVVAELTEAGELERRVTASGVRWTDDGEEHPHRSVGLRSIDDRRVRLVDAASDETLASLALGDALRDAHPGAIYYHQGRTYEVERFDLDRARALLRRTAARGYTRALREKRIEVETGLDSKTLEDHADLPVTLAAVEIRERVDGYVRFEAPGEPGERTAFAEPLPETWMRTTALYFPIPGAIEAAVRAAADDPDGFPGAIHALEHAMISLLPLELLCDRRDVGGLSTTRHPATGRSTVFVHDGHPGGVGLTAGAFDAVGALLDRTARLLRTCPCEAGCPACVQSPHCGNANDPLSKALARRLLDGLRGA